MIPCETKACDLAPLLAEALRSGQSVRFRAEGQSMRPFIRAGDLVVVAPAPPTAALRPGEVLLYERMSGTLRLHRLQRIARGDPLLLLRGDAPGQSMERVHPDQVLGVLTTYERNNRVHNARHPLRRLAGLTWPRLRNRMRIDKARDNAHDKASERPVDPPALTLVQEALKATLRGDPVNAPAAAVEPQALVAIARRHGVLALCARELVRQCPAAESTIRDTLRAMALEGETSRACVAEALDALRATGLAPLVVKGPALAAIAYRDATVRPYDDVDLLLDGHDRAQALDVLQGIDWRDSRNTPPLAQRHLLRTTEDLALVHPRCEVAIELIHTGGILRDAAPAAGSPPCPFDIHGAAAVAPSKTDHFLYCAAHGAKHGYTRLVWLADLDRLAAAFTGEDWNEVAAQARARHLTRILGLSASLAHMQLDTPFPPQIQTIHANPRWIAKTSAACLAAQSRGDRHVETWRWWLGLQDTVAQRLRHVGQWLFVPTGADLRAFTLPLQAHALYYVLRPLRLLTRLVFRRPAPKLTWERGTGDCANRAQKEE